MTLPTELPQLNRKLIAILAADVAGYTRLMERDERDTFQRLISHRTNVIEPVIAAHHGRIFKFTGDGVLAEFGSVVDAVACAVEIQASMNQLETELEESSRIRLRIGVNVGDVIQQPDGDIYGGGVNVAARLEALADPGSVCISATAYEQVHDKLDFAFEDLGPCSVKNIALPIRVYRVSPAGTKFVARVARSERPSIAVLPFRNMSVETDQDFFADGITEDITTALCKLRGFFVIARNTMLTYKGRVVDVRVVAQDLGVRYVLEGSVRKAGQRMRVSAQLIEAATGQHIWADSYDRELADVFAIQDEITANVVGRIGTELMTAEYQRISRKPPHSLDAWECVIRALSLSSQQSDAGSRQALALLDRAIDADPDYALALGLKAWIGIFRAFQNWDDMGAALGKAKLLIGRALAADADEPWPYLAQGMVGYATRDNALAMSALTRAVALSPSLVNAHGLLGSAHAFGGRAREAIACIDQAMLLSPKDAFLSDFQLYYAFAHFQGGNYEFALQHAQQSHRLRAGHPYPLLIAAACAGHLGMAPLATTLLRELRAIMPNASMAWVEATAPYVLPEDRERLMEGLLRAGLSAPAPAA